MIYPRGEHIVPFTTGRDDISKVYSRKMTFYYNEPSAVILICT